MGFKVVEPNNVEPPSQSTSRVKKRTSKLKKTLIIGSGLAIVAGVGFGGAVAYNHLSVKMFRQLRNIKLPIDQLKLLVTLLLMLRFQSWIMAVKTTEYRALSS